MARFASTYPGPHSRSSSESTARKTPCPISSPEDRIPRLRRALAQMDIQRILQLVFDRGKRKQSNYHGHPNRIPGRAPNYQSRNEPKRARNCSYRRSGNGNASGEKVSGVHMLVTEEAKLGRIRSAVENSYLVAAEIAGNGPFSIRFGAPHVRCSLKSPRNEEKDALTRMDGHGNQRSINGQRDRRCRYGQRY
ncbi:hypothetical protein GH714_026843 [Hevea brasiliensis]|uniref:Uncharacterized protein n=1 Tax=Hevea brasiliensis TaxID=3981 RepID=A0A6A6M4U1_HEVBR|nr:hypothetical protein GH714_026843 [Hevea brasiliensis]